MRESRNDDYRATAQDMRCAWNVGRPNHCQMRCNVIVGNGQWCSWHMPFVGKEGVELRDADSKEAFTRWLQWMIDNKYGAWGSTYAWDSLYMCVTGHDAPLVTLPPPDEDRYDKMTTDELRAELGQMFDRIGSGPAKAKVEDEGPGEVPF